MSEVHKGIRYLLKIRKISKLGSVVSGDGFEYFTEVFAVGFPEQLYL